MSKNLRKRACYGFLLFIFCLSLDRITKSFAESHLQGEPAIEKFSGVIRIQYAENTGAFLSLGNNWSPALRRTIFVVATGFVLLFMGLYLLRNLRMPRLQFWAFVLLLAGGVGNLLDRIRDGYVVDFLNVGIGSVRTGIFNVADMAITLAFILLLMTWIRPSFRSQPS